MRACMRNFVIMTLLNCFPLLDQVNWWSTPPMGAGVLPTLGFNPESASAIPVGNAIDVW